jgi:hypothetical protein
MGGSSVYYERHMAEARLLLVETDLSVEEGGPEGRLQGVGLLSHEIVQACPRLHPA